MRDRNNKRFIDNFGIKLFSVLTERKGKEVEEREESGRRRQRLLNWKCLTSIFCATHGVLGFWSLGRHHAVLSKS